jgi:hypothetical protein
MGRSWLRVLCLVGGFSAAGCTDYGTYTAHWQFGGSIENVSTDCGFHGVDSIRVIGTSTKGDHTDVTALCPPGELSSSVPVGTWTFAIHQIDVRGVPIDPKDGNGDLMPPMVGAAISNGDAVDLDLVMLTPRSVCADGIDNDRDGRVDADDPDCVADPNSATE